MRVLTVSVLGPLRVEVDGRTVPVTAGRLRRIVAALALSPGRAVPVDRLTSLIWGEDLPEGPRRSLQTYVGRLRSALGADAIRTDAGGYTLNVPPENVDAFRFGETLTRASQAADTPAERTLLAEALSLWRGEPFEGVDSDRLARTERPRLVERYLVATERLADLDIAAGRYGELAAHLEELTARYPLREPLWLRLLVVLHRLGRPAEALGRYEEIRRRLAEDLGVDPSDELRGAFADLLDGRPPAEDRYSGTARGSGAGTVPPRQLPVAVTGFTGRKAALAMLDGCLDDDTGPVVITAIAGTAGVGKTALAVHWGHRVAERFPDGQLYVDLRGFDPGGQVADPGEALRGFLGALGVPAQRIPAEEQAQAALYRSLLAGRRVLVVLDNAREAEQVRPLLPGSPGCLVVVTSRNQLTGLVTAEGARPVPLDLMTGDEARAFFADRLGPERVATEPEAVRRIIDMCARLPLALAIAAARAATRPDLGLNALAAELREAGGRLDALTTGDDATDVRSVFSWSYRALSGDAARLFRLLALHPGPDVTVPAAASLAGTSRSRTRALFTELTRAHLATEHAPGRYTRHDLLSAYAGELTGERDDEGERAAAAHRALDHYLYSAFAAARLMYPSRDPIDLTPLRPGVAPEDFADRREALAWFRAEHAVMISSVHRAEEAGADTHAWQLAWSLADYFNTQGHWSDAAAVWRVAAAAAHRSADHTVQARAHRLLASAYRQLGRHDDTEAELTIAFELCVAAGDELGQAHALNSLAYWCEQRRDYGAALEHSRRALAVYRNAGHRMGEATALNLVAWYHTLLGDHRPAIAHGEQALAMLRELDDRDGLAMTWDTVGYAHHHLGDHHRAVDYFRRAIAMHRDVGNRHPLPDIFVHLADALIALHDADAARTALHEALTILTELDHPDAAKVRAKLRDLDRGEGRPC